MSNELSVTAATQPVNLYTQMIWYTCLTFNCSPTSIVLCTLHWPRPGPVSQSSVPKFIIIIILVTVQSYVTFDEGPLMDTPTQILILFTNSPHTMHIATLIIKGTSCDVHSL